MLAFGGFDDAEGVLPLLRMTNVNNVISWWMAVAVVAYHTLVLLFLSGSVSRWLDHGSWGCWHQIPSRSRHAADEACRRARLFHCQRRARRRKQKGNSHCCFQCPFSKFHMPPPLPFRRRRNPSKDTQNEGSKGTKDEPTEISSTNDELKKNEVVLAKKTFCSSKSKKELAVQKKERSDAKIMDLARMQHWAQLLARTPVKKRDVKYPDADGLLPLHWACAGGPPLEVVEALLHAYPHAARRKDSDGSTPLHFASHYGGSRAVIRSLLLMYPDAASIKDKYGRTPLYHAVSKAASYEVLLALVKADPKMVLEACTSPTQVNRGLVRRPLHHKTPLFMAWNSVMSQRRPTTSLAGRAWDKAELLLRMAYTMIEAAVDAPARSFRMLHASIVFDTYLPPEVFHYALELYPEQVRQADEAHGKIPLALAAESRSQRAPELLSILLQAYPQGALVRDWNGRAPLALAVSSGKRWDKGVDQLFRAAPLTLGWRDRSTGLYPALLSATTLIEDQQDEQDAHCLTKSSSIKRPRTDVSSQQHSKALTFHQQDKMTESYVCGEIRQVKRTWDDIDTNTKHLSTIYELIRADPAVVKWP